ncbi:MAG: flagellar biosynthesis protein FlhB [Rhizobiaceae bacterium]|nr:flagellar biosynthesis protein FlhB [Rhizobiaceae bacterium]
MAEQPDKESKTEEASEKKIRDTIEKGKLPFAREAPIFASFVAILVFAIFFATDSAARMAAFLALFIERPEDWSLGTERDVILIMQIVMYEAGKILAVLMVLLISAALAASVLQNMPRMVLERIKPQFSRISLRQGFTRLFGAQGLAELLKSLGKLTFAGVILAIAMRNAQSELISGMTTHPAVFGLVINDIATEILVAITLVMLVIASADILWSRFHWLQDLRMTRQEVKDELKQTVGDPIVRMRIRSLQRDRARQRMMAAVPTATLIIANPTHFSIALRYVREENEAPVVVAKGQDLVALKIREIAEERGIPIFENVDLARSMFKQVSVDSLIPPQFYQAVAELVKIVYSRKPAMAGTRNR